MTHCQVSRLIPAAFYNILQRKEQEATECGSVVLVIPNLSTKLYRNNIPHLQLQHHAVGYVVLRIFSCGTTVTACDYEIFVLYKSHQCSAFSVCYMASKAEVIQRSYCCSEVA